MNKIYLNSSLSLSYVRASFLLASSKKQKQKQKRKIFKTMLS